MSGRCQGEKDAAADRRHQQALSDWSALPRRRRWLTRRPERERPGLPSPEEVAVARGELVGVVRSAMITELEKVVPRPRPASPPADGARTPPVAAARRDRLQVERPAEGRRQVPVRTPDTRPEPASAASPPRRPTPRDRGTGTRFLIDPRDDSGGSCPRRRPTARIAVDRATDPPGRALPTSGDPARMGAQRGSGRAGTIDPSCDPDPCPFAPSAPPGRLRQVAGQAKIARAMRAFFCPAVRGKDERHDRAEAHDPRKEAKR